MGYLGCWFLLLSVVAKELRTQACKTSGSCAALGLRELIAVYVHFSSAVHIELQAAG